MSVSNKMKYTLLRDSGLKVSRICVGCMSFGDRRSRYKWCVEEADALPILEASYKAGINFFDTAMGIVMEYLKIFLERPSRSTALGGRISL
jgi:predicted aldo/keto reductase-like oxidoreductase